jgi:hypothetical protein
MHTSSNQRASTSLHYTFTSNSLPSHDPLSQKLPPDELRIAHLPRQDPTRGHPQKADSIPRGNISAVPALPATALARTTCRKRAGSGSGLSPIAADRVRAAAQGLHKHPVAHPPGLQGRLRKLAVREAPGPVGRVPAGRDGRDVDRTERTGGVMDDTIPGIAILQYELLLLKTTRYMNMASTYTPYIHTRYARTQAGPVLHNYP